MGRFFRSAKLRDQLFAQRDKSAISSASIILLPILSLNILFRLPNVASIQEVFNTDREEYWGSGKINQSVEVIFDPNEKRTGIQIHLAPLSTIIFEVQFVF